MDTMSAAQQGGFLVARKFDRDKVFNTFVENFVEKGTSGFVSDSASDASTLCTTVSAGTCGVEPAGEALECSGQFAFEIAPCCNV